MERKSNPNIGEKDMDGPFDIPRLYPRHSHPCLCYDLNFNCPPKVTFQVETLFWGDTGDLKTWDLIGGSKPWECVLQMISFLAISWLSLFPVFHEVSNVCHRLPLP